MLSRLCAELKNYFLAHRESDIHGGAFTIASGSIESLPFLLDGQYYRIVGSVFNDGVHKYGDESDTLKDETFNGAIWAMSVPPEIVELAAEIEAWNTANGATLNSPYQSESFGGYSYAIKSGGSSSGAGDGVFGWQEQFADRLRPYRKLAVL